MSKTNGYDPKDKTMYGVTIGECEDMDPQIEQMITDAGGLTNFFNTSFGKALIQFIKSPPSGLGEFISNGTLNDTAANVNKDIDGLVKIVENLDVSTTGDIPHIDSQDE